MLPLYQMLKRSVWPKLLFFCFCSVVLAAAAPTVLEESPTTLVYPSFWHTPMGIHRGTPRLLEMFLGKQARFAAPQGLACTRYLSEPKTDPNDCRVTLAGSNSGLGQIIYNASMSRLALLSGAREPLFKCPMGIALSSSGMGYVADPEWPRVVQLRWREKSFQPDEEIAPPPGGWQKPWGVCLDSQNTLYVSDAGRNQILIFSAEGQFLKSLGPRLGPNLRLSQPQAIAVTDPKDTWSFYHDHVLCIIDQAGTRLIRVNLSLPDAEPASVTIASLPRPQDPAQWAWMDLDFYENIWITDALRDCVHKFDRHLNYLTSYGTHGEGDGRFDHPTGIAVFRHFGQVFVIERGGAHYFWVGTDILTPSITQLPGKAPAFEVRFFLTEPSRFSLTASTAEKKKAQTLFQSDWLDSGPHQISCTLPQDWTAPITLGLAAEATYSSATHFVRKQEWIWDGKSAATVPAKK